MVLSEFKLNFEKVSIKFSLSWRCAFLHSWKCCVVIEFTRKDLNFQESRVWNKLKGGTFTSLEKWKKNKGLWEKPSKQVVLRNIWMVFKCLNYIMDQRKFEKVLVKEKGYVVMV